MSRVFLSHSSRDSAEAVALKRWLVEQEPGLAEEIFLDLDRDTGIAPGERWKRALRQANERCEAVICLLSTHWVDSSECLAEYRTAETLGKLILCARLEPLDTAGITGEWQHCDLFGDGPTTEISLGGAGHSVTFQTDGLRRLRRGLRRAGIGAEQFAWPPPDDPSRPPYRGWEPLDESDAAVFFGRDAQIVRGLDALRGMRATGVESLFVVLGPSGVGKSSFLRAGLLPRLRRDDRHFLVAGIVRPEHDVMTGEHGLALAIHRLRSDLGLNQPALGDIKKSCLRADAAALAGLLDEVRQVAGTRLLDDVEETALPTVVLPLDQAEELFSPDAGSQAPRFLTLLAQLLGRGDGGAPGLIVACTIRTDFFGSLQGARQLSRLKSVVFDELRPLPTANYREVILGPAARSTAAGRPLTVQADLVERLQRDSSQGADSLPLLSLTLARLFEDYGSTGVLTLDGYEAMGGMAHVVQTQIDAVLSRDPVVRRSQLSRLRTAFIPWLATINPDNDQPVRRVARLSDLPADARAEIDALVSTRLLVQDERDGEVFIEVALESLLRQWGDLATWLGEEQDDLKEADNLERAAGAWAQNRRNPAWLLEGERLGRAESLVSKQGFRDRLGHTTDFLLASRAREDQRLAEQERRKAAELQAAREKQEVAEAHAAVLRRRSRILRAVLAVTVVVALAALAGFVLAVSAQRVATERTREAMALQLAAEGQARLAGARPGGEVLGMQQMLASRALKPTTEGDRALASSVVVQHDVHKMIPVGPPVQAVAYAPDGRLLASGDDGGAVRLWDAGSGQPVGGVLTGHQGAVQAVAFSPDGQRLVSAGDDGTVRLWDAGSGQPVGGVLTGHQGAVQAVAFSPDGKRIVSGGADGTVRLWDAGSGQPIGQPMTGDGTAVNAVATSPGGRLIASGGDDGSVRLWSAATSQPAAVPMTGHDGAVHAVSFDGDGRRIASAGHDRTVRLWDADTARPVGEPLRGHKNWVLDVAFSPDGERLVSASADYNLLLWDAQTGQVSGDPLTGHGQEVFSARFSPDGRRIVSGMGDGTIRLWDAQAPVPMLHGSWIFDLDVSGDGRLIATAGNDRTVRLWDVSTHRQSGASLVGHEGAVTGVAFSPDGRLVASSGADGTVRWWDVGTGQAVGEPLTGHEGVVTGVAFSPDGSRIASVGEDKTVRLWDARTRRQQGPALAGHEAAVRSVAFSPDGQRLASGGDDWLVRLWDAGTGAAIGNPLVGHWNVVDGLAFTPDNTAVVSGSWDGTVRTWPVPPDPSEALCSKLTQNLSHEQWRESVSPDVDYVATCPDLPVPVPADEDGDGE